VSRHRSRRDRCGGLGRCDRLIARSASGDITALSGADGLYHGVMSQSASQAAAFFREVASGGRVWTIRDADGYPAPTGSEGRAMPFWSSKARARRIVASIHAYAEFSVEEMTWSTFRDLWLPGLKRDGLQVGVNWTGKRATGYDMEPDALQAAVEAAISGDITGR
jgi:hypothetical protein